MTEDARQRENARSEEPHPVHLVKRAPGRSRLREALICPFCRDAVTRQGTVACARRGCGALYHRACWDEVARDYGGCAIYGCESKKAKEVSALGYVARMVRLLVATILLPPRVVRALRRHEEVGGVPLWRQALAMVLSRPISLFAAGAFLSAVAAYSWMWWSTRHHVSWDGVGYGIAACMLVTPFMFPVALGGGIVALKILASVLRSEFAALARADQPEGTVLGRLHRGGSSGKK